MPDYTYEQNALQTYKNICGVDEAGRGPLAGPVYAAAVILPIGANIPGLDDSKKLSKIKRNALFEIITKLAVSYSIAIATVQEIEEINILNAAMLAMERAVDGLSVTADYALIDGNKTPAGLLIPCEAVIKGDQKSMSIAAASVLAKVSRDRIMDEYDAKYPVYGFAKHSGYGTKLHMEMIKKHGICEIHRPSFLRKLIG